MAAELTVRYYRGEQENHYQSYGLRVVIQAALDMAKEVFMFQRGTAPAPSTGEEPTDEFVGIADPVDLQEIPVGAPDLQNEIPYYRLDEVTIWYRSMVELEADQALFAADLQKLVASMQALENLDVMTEEVYD